MYEKRNPRILAVDDDTAMLTLLRNLLADLDYEVAIADSGEVALSLFDKFDPDIVLTDIYMAAGDGHELIVGLRSRRRLLPIIAMSGAVNAGSVLEFARKIGADGVIHKPFRKAQLVEMLERYLHFRG
jgi:two-component system, HptB-dependent secretion and biofilm response regulator